jgi:DNA-binding transcriptional regulator YiaG
MAENEFTATKGNNMTTTTEAEILIMATETDQAKLIRDALDKLGVSIEELAELLGVSAPTVNSWLASSDWKMRREMPLTAKLLLARILADPKPAKRKR